MSFSAGFEAVPKRNGLKVERPDGGWLGFGVSHPSDKNKDVRWMGHPQFHAPGVG